MGSLHAVPVPQGTAGASVRGDRDTRVGWGVFLG